MSKFSNLLKDNQCTSHLNESHQNGLHFDIGRLDTRNDYYGDLKDDFENSLSMVRLLKTELTKLQEENTNKTRIIKHQADSIRLLTIENEAFHQGQSIYMNQIKKLDEENKKISDSYESKTAHQISEYKKEISALKETVNQKTALSNEILLNQSSLSIFGENRVDSVNRANKTKESNENGLKKKVQLLEVF